MSEPRHFAQTNYDEPLYDPEILKQVDFSKYYLKLNPRVSLLHPADGLLVRPLKSGDYDRDFLNVLDQLASVGNVSREHFTRRFQAMKKCNNSYYVTVIEDTQLNKVIGAATLVVEQKFLRGAGVRGLLEDVVVNDSYRGKQLGKVIVIVTAALAEHLGCYKITLNCKDKLVPFYSTLGYAFEPGRSNNAMTIRFNPPPKLPSNL